jgi:hypothetical protein
LTQVDHNTVDISAFSRGHSRGLCCWILGRHGHHLELLLATGDRGSASSSNLRGNAQHQMRSMRWVFADPGLLRAGGPRSSETDDVGNRALCTLSFSDYKAVFCLLSGACRLASSLFMGKKGPNDDARSTSRRR